MSLSGATIKNAIDYCIFFKFIWVIYFSLFKVFSNDGQFKMRFGVRGRSPGQLQRPTGVTVDMNGDIIVADYDNRWISIFSSDGKFKVSGLIQGGKRYFLCTNLKCSTE